MSIVERVKELCKKHNTSIPKLEKEIGLGHGSLYNWDTNSPSIDKVQRVAAYFKTSVDYLIGTETVQSQALLECIPTDMLVQELSQRQGVQAFTAGLYSKHDASVKRKYSNDRTPVVSPDSATILVVEEEVKTQMQLATFNAVCDVELGDKVRFASTEITEITDIRTVHYLKDQRVEFEFELGTMPGYWYKRQDFIYPL